MELKAGLKMPKKYLDKALSLGVRDKQSTKRIKANRFDKPSGHEKNRDRLQPSPGLFIVVMIYFSLSTCF